MQCFSSEMVCGRASLQDGPRCILVAARLYALHPWLVTQSNSDYSTNTTRSSVISTDLPYVCSGNISLVLSHHVWKSVRSSQSCWCGERTYSLRISQRWSKVRAHSAFWSQDTKLEGCSGSPAIKTSASGEQVIDRRDLLASREADQVPHHGRSSRTSSMDHSSGTSGVVSRGSADHRKKQVQWHPKGEILDREYACLSATTRRDVHKTQDEDSGGRRRNGRSVSTQSPGDLTAHRSSGGT